MEKLENNQNISKYRLVEKKNFIKLSARRMKSEKIAAGLASKVAVLQSKSKY